METPLWAQFIIFVKGGKLNNINLTFVFGPINQIGVVLYNQYISRGSQLSLMIN